MAQSVELGLLPTPPDSDAPRPGCEYFFTNIFQNRGVAECTSGRRLGWSHSATVQSMELNFLHKHDSLPLPTLSSHKPESEYFT